MRKHGFASGSQLSRRADIGSQVWAAAACLLLLCACSGGTDVVGVLPGEEIETGALEGASSQGPGSEGVSGITNVEGSPAGAYLFVAGMRVEDWDRSALEWPFEFTLREFFADGSRPGPFGPPASVEREVIAVMGPSARAEHVRFVAAAPKIIERLRDVFAKAEVELDGEMVARVMRDHRSDEYRVALGPCGNSSGHHGGPCAEVSADGLEHP